MKGKKGQAITLETAPKIVLILVILGMIVGASVIALSGFRTSTYDTESHSDIQHTASNTTYTYFADTTMRVVSCSGATFSNGTNAVDVTTYFTVDAQYGCTAIVTNDSFNGETINASYTATVTSTASDVINKTMQGGNNFSDQLPTVGTMIGIGMLLFIVIGTFAMLATKGGLTLK